MLSLKRIAEKNGYARYKVRTCQVTNACISELPDTEDILLLLHKQDIKSRLFLRNVTRQVPQL